MRRENQFHCINNRRIFRDMHATEFQLGPKSALSDLENGEQLVTMDTIPSYVDQSDIVLAGFLDCCSEALRYLQDVEQISEEDPLIQGLKLHLAERQENLNLDRIIDTDSSIDLESIDDRLSSDADLSMLSSSSSSQSDANTSVTSLSDSDVTSMEEDDIRTESSSDFDNLNQNNAVINALAEELLLLIEGGDVSL